MNSLRRVSWTPASCCSSIRWLLTRGLFAAAIVTLGACGGEVSIRESRIEANLPEKTAPIVLGKTDRTEVRQLLGEPWLASDYWQFELFRMSGKDVRALAIFAPIPVPVGVFSDEVRGYVLVSYDASGSVSAYDKGVTHGENLSWRAPVEGEDSILLMAGDAGFAVETFNHTPSVFVSAARRDDYLNISRPADKCTILVGCQQDQCSNTLVLDAGQPRPLPGVLSRIRKTAQGGIKVLTQRWLAPVTLQPGLHRIEIPRNPHTTLEASTEFICSVGDLMHAVIAIESGDTSEAWRHWKTQVHGSINVSKQMPEALRGQPMLVWRGEEWLVSGP